MKNIIILLCVSITFSFSSISQPTVGLIEESSGSLEGYVLFAPFASKTTYLIDKCGSQINTWTSQYRPGYSCYLLEDGSLLRACDTNSVAWQGAIGGGIIEKHDWEGNLTWTYLLLNDTIYQDHDICPLPNGNVLAVVLNKKSSQFAISEGRNPALIGNAMWNTKILELHPIGTDSAEIVWEWSSFDHLIQDFDNTKENYGIVSDHPELLNINFSAFANSPDWLHVNSVAYNQELDQIVLSSNHFCEFWIIDHSITTAEAASHSGGNSGKGGDILYRWGNPQAYSRGISTDQKLYNVHNANWIKNGDPGEGEIILFNNGNGRPGGDYSTVDSYLTSYDSNSGDYLITSGQPYLPSTSSWSYSSPTPTDFFSAILAGAERLSNGNTLICEATTGHFFEVTSDNEVVWNYVSPVGSNGIATQGSQPLNNYVYRCSLYEPDYPAFSNKTLTPGDQIELNPLPLNCLSVDIENVETTNLSLTVFPNPFDYKLTFSFNTKHQENYSLLIYDYTGKIVLRKDKLLMKEHIIERDELPSNGLYFYTIHSVEFNSSGKFILR